MRIQRICKFCELEFTARTTVTKYCSDSCSKRAYKARKRSEKIDKSNKETVKKKLQPSELLKAKEFLTVSEVAQLLSCSVRTAYNHIDNGTIRAVNLGQRMTRVRRSDIDSLFQPEKIIPTTKYEIKDCYNLTEIQSKYGLSEGTVRQLIKRNNVPKIKKGWYAYVPKKIIDELLT